MIKTGYLSKEKEKKLISMYLGGDKTQKEKAYTQLLHFGEFLVAGVVSKYQNSKVSYKELYRLGVEGWKKGLQKFIEKKHLSQKYKFGTYSTWWIRAEIHKKLGFPIDPKKK